MHDLLNTRNSNSIPGIYGSIYLTQESQFLEIIGGSNLPQASPNYLIWMYFIRITMVWMH